MPERSGTRPSRVIFRCDGGISSGLGHVSRCLGLAEAFAERGVDVSFVGDHSPHARALLAAAGMRRCEPGGPIGSTADLTELWRLARGERPSGWIVDSYLADASYLAALGKLAPVVLVDDFARLPTYPCAGVLNMTLTGLDLPYPDGPKKLLGPSFLLARRAVRRFERHARPTATATRVLVALGGVDRHGLTGTVLRTLATVDAKVEVRVVVRADDTNFEDVERRARAFATAEVSSNLDNLAAVYDWADACVSGGGLMKYEAGLLGLPVGVLAQTPGEAADVKRCAEVGFVLDLGGPDVADRPARASLEMLLHDTDLRGALHDASVGVFGHDPTAHATDAVLQLLAAGKVAPRGGQST